MGSLMKNITASRGKGGRESGAQILEETPITVIQKWGVAKRRESQI